METVKIEKKSPTYEGLYLKMKAQMIFKLGYDEKKAREHAEMIASFYKGVYVK